MNVSRESLYAQHSSSSYDIAFLTVADISEFIGVSKSKLYKDIRDGKLIAERNLDETTVISPRELQSAYPDIDVADIFDIDLPAPQSAEMRNETADRQVSPVTATATERGSKLNRTSGLSSLEMALQKQQGNDVSAAMSGREADSENTPADDFHQSVVEDTVPHATPRPRSIRFSKAMAALVLASSILLVVLAIL
ncbi:MAG: helix-turn-helix transcriptional regulator [Gammaproteobacteria bacterium]